MEDQRNAGKSVLRMFFFRKDNVIDVAYDIPGVAIEKKGNIVENGTLNHRNEPADKDLTGGWSVTPHIYGAHGFERMATVGITFNLVYYLAVQMELGTAAAVSFASNAFGTHYVSTLIGGVIADQWLGRFWTLLLGGAIQLLAYILMTLQATIPFFNNMTVIYVATYMLMCGNGLFKALGPFGADQFDHNDRAEKILSMNYFNWAFFSTTTGAMVAVTFFAWVQMTYGYGWGFGQTILAMLIAITTFISGRTKYRYSPRVGSPISGALYVISQAIKNYNIAVPADSCMLHELPEAKDITSATGFTKLKHTNRLRFLDKAAVVPTATISHQEKLPGINLEATNMQDLPTVTQVEEVKQILLTIPIFLATFLFWTIDSQIVALSVLQGVSMEKRLLFFTIPPSSLVIFLYIFILITVIILARIVIPLCRKITGLQEGITSLQKMGFGLVLCILAMSVAAMVERKRHHNAYLYGEDDKPSVLWLIPQYSLLGMAEALMFTGQLEFAYSQSPPRLRTLGTAICLCSLAVGNFMSTAFVKIVQKITTSNGGNGWLGNDMDKDHLDFFYITMAIVGATNLVMYLAVAKWFKYMTFNIFIVEPVDVQEHSTLTIQEFSSD